MTSAIDEAQALDEIASLLTSRTAWMDGPHSGPVAGAIADLTSRESLSSNAIRESIDQVLIRGAVMLEANGDSEGAARARDAREAMLRDALGPATELVSDLVGTRGSRSSSSP